MKKIVKLSSSIKYQIKKSLTVALKIICALDMGDNPNQSLPNSRRLLTQVDLLKCLYT